MEFGERAAGGGEDAMADVGRRARRPRIPHILRLNARLLAGLVVTASVAFLGIAAPLITWNPPLETLVGPPFTPPGPAYPFGTDDLGRDLYAATLYGIRTSLLVGFLSAVIAMAIGVLIGAVAGYYRGLVDEVLMRISDIGFIIPSFLLALLIAMILGPSIWNITAAIGVTSWPGIARISRAEFLRIREMPFIEASRAVGVGDLRIMFRHILPNTLPSVITYIVLQTSSNILVEAGLSFLGVSDPNMPSLGMLLNTAQQYLTTSWWMAVFPGLILSLIIVGLNMLGDGLIEQANPRLRRG